MLTKLTIRNFKRFDKVEVELGSPVLFIGPNNSGKTSVMQALALWDTGLRRWHEKRGKSTPEKRPGVTVNRRDLVAIPIPKANLLWRDLRTRNVQNIEGRQTTSNIRIDLIVEGITNDRHWKCGLEFDYANEEAFHCRPLRLAEGKAPDRMPVPEDAADTRVAFLPPMSGLAATEVRLDHGAVNVRIGEGRTAEVLRNLCFRIDEEEPTQWERSRRSDRPTVRLETRSASVHSRARRDRHDVPRAVNHARPFFVGTRLAADAASPGLHVLQIPAQYCCWTNPTRTLRSSASDRSTAYCRMFARDSGSQIIAASHSEVLLNEAAGQDLVVAFVGQPHRIDDRGSQVLKSLREIGFDQYYQAQQTGWVLYLEGSTDLSILRVFAQRLGHAAATRALERPFAHFVGNQPRAVQNHFHGLREALPALRGIALFDRLDAAAVDIAPTVCLIWNRREIENYVCSRATLEAYARASAPESAHGPIFTAAEADRRLRLMREAVEEIESALKALNKPSPWGPDIKASDDFLTPLFSAYFGKLGLPNLMAKKNFHELAEHVPDNEIDHEIHQKLDAIVRVAEVDGPA